MNQPGDLRAGPSTERRAHWLKMASIMTEGPAGALAAGIREYEAALDAARAEATALRQAATDANDLATKVAARIKEEIEDIKG